MATAFANLMYIDDRKLYRILIFRPVSLTLCTSNQTESNRSRVDGIFLTGKVIRMTWPNEV